MARPFCRDTVLAVQEAEWVFQVDSDNEIKAEHFRKLWAEE